MIISPDTAEVMKFLDDITGSGLRKRNDLATILELGASTGNHELIDDILFNAKYLWNLNQTISKADAGTDGLAKLHQEYKETGLKLSDKLSHLIEQAEEQDKSRFAEIYFKPTSGAFRNLIDLSHDLAKLKEVQTTMKGK
jgi:hypothetical protein